LHFFDAQHFFPQHLSQHSSTEHPAGQALLVHTAGFFAISGEQQPFSQHTFFISHDSNLETWQRYDFLKRNLRNNPLTGALFALTERPQEPYEHSPANDGKENIIITTASMIFFIFTP